MSRTSFEQQVQWQGARKRGLVLLWALPGNWLIVSPYAEANNCCEVQQVCMGVTSSQRGVSFETNSVLVFKEFVQLKTKINLLSSSKPYYEYFILFDFLWCFWSNYRRRQCIWVPRIWQTLFPLYFPTKSGGVTLLHQAESDGSLWGEQSSFSCDRGWTSLWCIWKGMLAWAVFKTALKQHVIVGWQRGDSALAELLAQRDNAQKVSKFKSSCLWNWLVKDCS